MSKLNENVLEAARKHVGIYAAMVDEAVHAYLSALPAPDSADYWRDRARLAERQLAAAREADWFQKYVDANEARIDTERQLAAAREALTEIEYLDRPQVRGQPRRVSIGDIARAALANTDPAP